MQQRGLHPGPGRHARPGGAVLIDARPARFEADVLAELDARREVIVETPRRDGATRRTTIWTVVVDGQVYARSWLGERGRWYRAALEAPDEVALRFGRRVLPVRVAPASDEASVARCSSGLEKKYSRSRSLEAMLLPGILHTTVRFEPRQPLPQ